MSEIRFDWDPIKAQTNIEKHGITFEEATTVFFNEDAVLLMIRIILKKRSVFYCWDSVKKPGYCLYVIAIAAKMK